MELKFRPRFNRDLLKLKGKKELNERIHSLIKLIKSAQNISELPGHKFLDKYKTRLRIKIKLNTKENYRMGLIVKGNAIWAERILPRPDFYKYYRR